MIFSSEKKIVSPLFWASVIGLSVILFPLMGRAAESSDKYYPITRMLDQPVQGSGGEVFGEIDDFVVKRNGKVKKAIVSIGGFLDIGDKDIGVPFRELKIQDGDKIALTVTREQLRDRPEFDYRKQGLYKGYYYGPYYPPRHPEGAAEYPVPPYPYGYGPHYHYGYPYAPYAWDPDRYRRQPWEEAYFPARMLASVILGRAVINRKGETIGEVEDILLDQNGTAVRIVLSAGGFLDMGDRLVAVPYEPLGFSYYGITYDISGKELKELPAFSY